MTGAGPADGQRRNALVPSEDRISISSPGQKVWIDPDEDRLYMNRHRLENKLMKWGQSQTSAKNELWTWVGTSLGLGLALVPGDFKKFAGVSADAWETAAAGGLIVCLGMAARSAWSWVRSADVQSPEALVKELMDEMVSH